MTAITEITRDANSASVGLKTISQRIRGVADDGEQMSGKLQGAFDSLGIGIQVVNSETGEMASTFDILTAVAGKWDELNDSQRQYIGELMAGKNQISNLNALMKNYQVAIDATASAQHSAGSANEENAKALDSIQGKIQELKKAFQDFALKTINSEFVKSIITITTQLIKFINKIGGIKPILVAIIGLKFGSYLSKTSKTLQETTSNVGKLNQILGKTEKAQDDVAKKNGSLKASFTKLQIGISAVSLAVSAGIAIWDSYKQKQKENEEVTLERAKTANEEVQTLKEKVSEYESLNQQLGQVTSEEEKKSLTKDILTLQDEINDMIKEQGKSVDLLNGKYEEQASILRTSVRGQLDKTKADLEAALKVAEGSMQEGIELDHVLESADIGGKVSTQIVKATGAARLAPAGTATMTLTGKTVEEQRKTLEYYRDSLMKASQGNNDFNDALKWVESQLQKVTEKENNLSEAQKNLNKIIAQQKFYDMGGDLIKTQDDFDEFIKKIDGSDQVTTKFNKSIGVTKVPLTETQKYLIDLAKEAFPQFAQSVDESSNATDGIVYNLEKVNKAIDNTQSSMSTLDKAIEEYNSSEGLSLDTLQALIELGGDYNKMLEIENGQLQLTEEGQEALNNKLKEQIQTSAMTAAYNELVALANQRIAESAEQSKSPLDNFNSRLITIGDNAKSAALDIALTGASMRDMLSDTQSNVITNEDINNIVDKYTKLGNSVYNTVSKTTSQLSRGISSGASKSSKSQTDAWKDAFTKEYNLLKHNLEMSYITEEDYTNQLEVLYKKYFSDREKYADEYMKYEEEVFKKRKQLYTKAFDDEYNALKYSLNMNAITEREYTDKLDELYKRYFSGKREYLDEYTKYEQEVYKNMIAYIKEDYQTAISLAQESIDAQIKELEKQKSQLQKVNDEKEKSIELEKLQMALEKAKAQRNIRVYHEGQGWVWEADAQAIEEAEKALEEFETQQAIDEIDNQIDALQDLKDKWGEIASNYQTAQDRINVTLRFGADFEKQVLDGRLEYLNYFINEYNNTMNKLNQNTSPSVVENARLLGQGEVSVTPIESQTSSSSSGMVSSIGATLKKGSRGDDVKALQTALNEILGSGLTVDGIFGTNTHNAVKQFQSMMGIASDGIVGANTKNAFSQRGYANGTTSAVGGLSLVGEQGAELRVLNRGDGIISSALTSNLMDWGKLNPISLLNTISQKKGNTIHIGNISLPNVNNGKQFVTELEQIAVTYNRI